MLYVHILIKSRFLLYYISLLHIKHVKMTFIENNQTKSHNVRPWLWLHKFTSYEKRKNYVFGIITPKVKKSPKIPDTNIFSQ